MRNNHLSHQCVNCHTMLTPTVLHYSVKRIGHPLCLGCQDSLKVKLEHTSRETVKLYFLLKQRGIAAQLQKEDHLTATEIVIVNAKVNIEVDFPQHHYHRQKALSQLKSTYHSFEKGYYTLKIPNELVAYDTDDAVDFIEEFLQVSCQPKSYYQC